jgi:hypothetical protein
VIFFVPELEGAKTFCIGANDLSPPILQVDSRTLP